MRSVTELLNRLGMNTVGIDESLHGADHIYCGLYQ